MKKKKTGGEPMQYRYETHCHCSQCSACAVSTSQELVRAYKAAGYAGMVLTDHFIFGNTAVNRRLPWEAQMAAFHRTYLEAKAAAEGLDFDVIFGIEHAYGDGKEVLVYGVGIDFFLNNPDIPRISLDELTARIHDAGGIVIQAHPYRDRWYVNMNVEPRRDLVDGIEVYNACNAPGEDLSALKLAREKDYIVISGGDIHCSEDQRIGKAGIVLPHRVRNSKEFAEALINREHSCIVNGNIVSRILPEHLA